MAADRLIVEARDGWPVSVTVHPAHGPARGVVLAVHAMMVDGRSLDRPAGGGLASVLAEAGLEVWRVDLRGHGASGPSPADGGRWTYDDLVRHDLPALVEAASRRGLPVTVLGHSLGGHVAAAAAAEGLAPHALVLLAANVWLKATEPSRRRGLRKAAGMAAFEAAARAAGRFPSRALRVGPADEAEGYVRDLCRFWWTDRWCSRDGTDWWAGLARYPGRVLAIAGAGDALYAPPECVRLFVDRFGPGRVDFWLAARGRFGLDVDPGHMGLAT